VRRSTTVGAAGFAPSSRALALVSVRLTSAVAEASTAALRGFMATAGEGGARWDTRRTITRWRRRVVWRTTAGRSLRAWVSSRSTALGAGLGATSLYSWTTVV